MNGEFAVIRTLVETLMKTLVKTLASGLFATALVLVIGGCLPFPLGDAAKSKVDLKLTGFWMNEGDDEREVVAMYPFDEHTYVVEDVKLKKQDDKWQPQGPAQLYKGWLTNIKDVRFLTLEMLQQRLPGDTSEQKAYPVMRVTLDGDKIVARMVNGDAEQIKNVKSGQSWRRRSRGN